MVSQSARRQMWDRASRARETTKRNGYAMSANVSWRKGRVRRTRAPRASRPSAVVRYGYEQTPRVHGFARWSLLATLVLNIGWLVYLGLAGSLASTTG